ncbi:porin [Halarcobacter ebronensis]|uniref:porin n=1 Tax=Halarcobacter ebronensis TaxID=1462615 RepID=UPI003C776CB0
MKKFAKMSLVAALAVAGTAASAQPLAEAIKNVDVSGTVAYRYNDYEETTGGLDNSSSTNNYKIALNLKSKVNEDITANTRFIIGSGLGGDAASLDTHTGADGQVDVTLSEVNFTYTGLANTAITIGKQGLATPFTVHRDAMGNEQTGTGILAQTNFGPVTLAGAYFNQTNLGTLNANNNPLDISGSINVDGVAGKDINGDENVIVAGAILNIAGITADAWYVDLQDVFDAYTIGLAASYNISDVKLAPYARYTSLDLDEVSTDNKLWKVGMRAQMGIFGAHLGYGKTDKEGGVTDLDGSAETGYDEHWRVTLSGQTDSDVIYASVNAQVLPSLNISLNYSDLDNDSNDTQETEIYTQVKYDMSKNFYTFVRFGQYEVDQTGDDIDSTIGRVHVQYSF